MVAPQCYFEKYSKVEFNKLRFTSHQWRPTKFWDLNCLLEMLLILFQFMMYGEPGTCRILIYLPTGHWMALGPKLNTMWDIILTLCKMSRFETSSHLKTVQPKPWYFFSLQENPRECRWKILINSVGNCIFYSDLH